MKATSSLKSKKVKRTRYFRSLGVMAFLLKGGSPECVKSELNLFLAPPTQTVIEKGQWVQFHPITNVADGGPIEFLIPGSGDAYLDLSNPITCSSKIFKSDGHAALERTTAKYLQLIELAARCFSIPQSSYSFIQDNVFSGQMPKRIVIACVDNDAFNGNYKKSPFEFKHYDVNFIGVYVDGQPVPHQPLRARF
ncbi:uncharacterized protein F54H12.2 [Trichonephila clavipes]|nr:uncharacterized protein F54H12.2 [Trichonephila clavipes]